MPAPRTQQPEDLFSTAPASRRRLVLSLLKPYRRWLLLLFVVMSLEALMGLAAPWPLKIIIDQVIGGKPLPPALSFLEGYSNSALTLVAVGSVVVFALLGAMAGYLNSYYTESVAQYVANDLRQKMYHHLQRLSLSFYDSHQIAKIVNTITADVTTVQDFASQSILRMVVDMMTITGMLFVMFYLHWDFALVAVAITPFLLLFVARFKQQVKKATREVRKDQGIMAAVMQQGLESMRSVNAFGRQDLEEERLRKASLETVQAALKARKLKALLAPVINISVAICIALVLWRGTSLVLQEAMTVGALTVFLAYLAKFFTPVQDMAKMTNIIAQTSVALERIQLILDDTTMIPEKPAAIRPGRLKGNIVFEHVDFSYTNRPVLRDLCLSISQGQRIGICGPSGCGKSTIASLIARFYDISGGGLFIDGLPVQHYTLEGLRSQIGFVLQDTFIFYGSIRDNIAYGRPEASEASIIEAAQMARAHEFITQLPEGYDTIVGERGITLSGGQKQCIGIARAILRNAPVLILDEPTASLDTESEKIVMEALEKLMTGRTVITIAHRLSTLRDADTIFVLREGCIAEQGTHEQLLKKGGLYEELYALQSGRLSTLKGPLEKEKTLTI